MFKAVEAEAEVEALHVETEMDAVIKLTAFTSLTVTFNVFGLCVWI